MQVKIHNIWTKFAEHQDFVGHTPVAAQVR